MLVGHYSASFVAKAAAPRVPIWVLLLAAQLVDVVWAVFVLLGIEHVHLDPGLPSNAMVLDSIPYTHSLLGTLVWAGAAGFLVSRVPAYGAPGRVGVVVALVVASHWALDLLVHRPDLTLWGAPPKLGFALWNVPWLAYVLELMLLVGSAAFLGRRCVRASRDCRGIVLVVGLLVGLQATAAVAPVPASVGELVSSATMIYLGVAYVGFLAERWATARRRAP